MSMRNLFKPNDDKCLDFDMLLQQLNDFGLYQKHLVVYMLPFFFVMGFIYLGQIFIVLEPFHWCYIPELKNLSKDDQLNLAIPKKNGHFDKCRMYDTDYAQALANNMTKANDSWPIKPCESYIYDTELVTYETIVTEYDWVCEHNDLATYSVTVFFLGAIVGGLLFGFVSDRWGRVPAIMLSNAFAFVGGVLSSFSRNFLIFSLTRFIVGMSFDNCTNQMYILVLEFVGPQYRVLVTNFAMIVCFVPAMCALPWIAYLCNGWRLFSVVISIPILFSLLTYFFISESVRWLISAGKTEKAIKVVKTIARTNKRPISDQTLLQFERCCKQKLAQDKTSHKYTLLDLFNKWSICRINLLLVVIWMITALVYDAHVRATVRIGPDVYITFSVAALTEMPASILPIFVLDRLGRKLLSFIMFIGSVISCIVAAALHANWEIAAAAVIGRFCLTVVFNIGLQWAAEILPTVLRGQGVALVHVMGFVASLLSPFIIYTGHYAKYLPMSIMAVLSLLGAIVTVSLPETAQLDLPNTTSEADFTWSKQSKFSLELPKRVDLRNVRDT